MSQVTSLSILGIPRGVRTFLAKVEASVVRDIVPFTAFLHPLRQAELFLTQEKVYKAHNIVLRQTELFLTQEKIYKAHIVKDKIERLEF